MLLTGSNKRTRLSCPICQIGFDQSELMDIHMLSHRQSDTEDVKDGLSTASDLNLEGNLHTCPACSLGKFL